MVDLKKDVFIILTNHTISVEFMASVFKSLKMYFNQFLFFFTEITSDHVGGLASNMGFYLLVSTIPLFMVVLVKT